MKGFSLPARNRRICFSTSELEIKKESSEVTSETQSPRELRCLVKSNSTLEDGSGYRCMSGKISLWF
jgi:hypothetical protein